MFRPLRTEFRHQVRWSEKDIPTKQFTPCAYTWISSANEDARRACSDPCTSSTRPCCALSLTVNPPQALKKLSVSDTISSSFTSTDRLLNERQYSYVFADPIKSADASYTVLARPNTHTGPRLGVIVSKKNVARAVVRNRLKRIIRESFRCNKNIIPAFDVIVICKKNSARNINRILFEQLQNHWKFLHNHAQ